MAKMSFRTFHHANDPRRFIHLGELVEDASPALQTEPFFNRFTTYLRERCATGPEVTRLNQVASTRR
jgi:hypothetical protein